MTTEGGTSERVQYEIEVATSGQEELDQLLDQLRGLDRSGQRNTQASRQLKQVGEDQGKTAQQTAKTTKATKQQDLATDLLNNRLEKFSTPLRTVGGLFSKLNPQVLAASLGLGGMVATVGSLAGASDKYEASLADTGSALILNTGLEADREQVMALLDRYSGELGLKQSDVEAGLQRLSAVTLDGNLALSLLAQSFEAAKVSGGDFNKILDRVVQAWSEGITVRGEGGELSRLMNMDAVRAVLDSYLAMEDGVIENREIIANEMGLAWEDFKRVNAEGAKNLQTFGSLLALSLMSDDPEEVGNLWKDFLTNTVGGNLADAGDILVKGPGLGADVGGAIWDQISGTWNQDLESPFFLQMGTMLSKPVNWQELQTSWNKVPEDIRRLIMTDWEAKLEGPWWNDVELLFEVSKINGIAQGGFSELDESLREEMAPQLEALRIWLDGEIRRMWSSSTARFGRGMVGGPGGLPGGPGVPREPRKKSLAGPGGAWEPSLPVYIPPSRTPAGLAGLEGPGVVSPPPGASESVANPENPVPLGVYGLPSAPVTPASEPGPRSWSDPGSEPGARPWLGFGSEPGARIPGLAEGGIVRQPTLVRAGEEGEEVIAPLSRLNQLLGVRDASEPPEPSGLPGLPGLVQGGIVQPPTLARAGETGGVGEEVIAPLSRLNQPPEPGGGGAGGGTQEISIYLGGQRIERFVLERLDRRVRLRGAQ